MKRILPWVMSALLALTCINIAQPSVLAAGTNLVVNGSFEEPAIDILAYPDSIPGWQLSAGPAVEFQKGAVGQSYDGKQLVELDGLEVSGIYQDIPTKPGNTYKVSFAFSPRPGVADNKLNVSWGDTTVAQIDKSGESLADIDWQVYTYDLKATSDSTRLSFDDLNETSDGLGALIDAVSVVKTIAADAPCSEGAKSNLIDFNSSGPLNSPAKPISSGGVTVSFEGLNVIETGSSKGGFSTIKLGNNQVMPSDRNNFNGRFLSARTAIATPRENNYRRVIKFSRPVNNVCFYVADIDYGDNTVKVSNSKGESLYSKSFDAATKADAALTVFDWSKLEGIKTIEVIGNDAMGIDNLSFN